MRWIRSNGLSIFFLLILVAALIGQAISGVRVYNGEQLQHGGTAISQWEYVKGPIFWGHVMENWESEFLQFTLFIGATVLLVQRGSAESKEPQNAGRAPHRPGFRGWLYGNSLVLSMTAIFLATWAAQSLGNLREFNSQELEHGGEATTWLEYIASPDFWERTFQNWQSEFLAVGTMVVFSIYLRQAGSPESKRLDTPHSENTPTY